MDIASDWLKSTQAQLVGLSLNSESEKAIIAAFEICADNPDEAVNLISNIIEQKPNKKLLACLGAGPIEELLVKHPDYLNKLMEAIPCHAALKMCLQHVNTDEDDAIDKSMLNDFINSPD